MAPTLRQPDDGWIVDGNVALGSFMDDLIIIGQILDGCRGVFVENSAFVAEFETIDEPNPWPRAPRVRRMEKDLRDR